MIQNPAVQVENAILHEKADTRAMSWKRAFGVAGIVFLFHWFVIFAGWYMPLMQAPIYLNLTHTPFDHLLQWDAQWNAAIAQYGYNIPFYAQYAFAPVGNSVPFPPLQAAAYFPLVPIIAHVFGMVGGLVVGNIAFYTALVFMYVLFREKLSDTKSFLALTLYATSLTAVYDSALYAQPYMLLFSALAIYGIRRGDKWGDILACVAGYLATLNHEMGILLGIFALRYLRERRVYMAFIYGGSVLAGWATFAAYLGIRFGQPFAMFHAEKAWQRIWAFPGYNWFASLTYHQTLDTVFVPIIVLLIVLHIRHAFRSDTQLLHPIQGSILESQEIALWMAAILLLGMCTFIPHDPLVSVTRLLDGAWPMFGFMWFRGERSSRWMFGLLALFCFFGMLGAGFFTHGIMFE